MTNERTAWRRSIESWPCQTCGASPGESCVTGSGRPTNLPHAARLRSTNRCQMCLALLPNEWEDTICERCQLVRALEVERASHYRRDPEP